MGQAMMEALAWIFSSFFFFYFDFFSTFNFSLYKIHLLFSFNTMLKYYYKFAFEINIKS